ncbi:MAG: NADH-quinone oxidoreductase subunit NuoK [candidate division Zixibacteria bacterium CG_4_9_14_3_um_filter_46_8]|nr:MAG: NADH-quinone oxidoreductase subunit NuoK [candidate division Zixibacteria bacterium CG_4_9_14_3_um_filter_46_8]
MVTLEHYLILSALLFCVGIFGLLTRRNAVGVLMSIELMFNSANINFIAFSKFITPEALTGQIFAIFVITIAAAEATVGLAIVVLMYRNFNAVNVDKINFMKW